MLTRQMLNKTLRCSRSSISTQFCLKQLFPNGNTFRISPTLLQKNAQFCTALHNRTFHEKENMFISNIISNNTNLVNHELPYKGEIIKDGATFTNFLNKDWRRSNPTDILTGFQTVKDFCVKTDLNFTDPRFDSLVDGLMDHCDKFTDKQLLELLHCIAEYPLCKGIKLHNFHDMWSCLDDICCWKLSGWDMDTRFAFANAFYKLKLGKIADYIFTMIDKSVKKADYLTKDELLMIFFCFNICRKRPVDFEFQCAVDRLVDEMNVDELAVIALGFFKSQTKIKLQHTMEAMIREVTSNAMGIHEITLTGIMKSLRFSYPTKLLPQINKMLDLLYPELDRVSELACLHIALLATGLQSFHEDILRKCSQRLVENLPNMRIKDVDRFLNVLTMFNFDPKTTPDAFETALNELHNESRIPEFTEYPRVLISILHYLSLRAIYPYELIAKVLDYEFIVCNFGKTPKTLPRQIFVLDACIDIECPDYNGPRLPPVLKYKAAKWLSIYPPSYEQWRKINFRDQLYLDTVDTVEKIAGGKDFVTIQHVLTHFSAADIIICKDIKTGAFIKPFGFERYILGDIMKPFNDGSLKWYAVVVLTWNHTMRENNAPLGILAMKQRQLEKIGFTPVMVKWMEFQNLSPERKVQYILDKLV